MVLGLNAGNALGIDPEDEARRQAAIQARVQQTAQAAAGAGGQPATPGARIGLGPGPVPATPGFDPAAQAAQPAVNLTQRVLNAPVSGGMGTQTTGQDSGGAGLLENLGQKFAAGFKADPIGSIGLILAGIGGNTDAIKAYQGIRGEQAARERLKLDTSDLLRLATKDGLDMLAQIPEKDREEAAMQFCMQYEGFSSGYCDFFDMMARRPDGREMARAASENWPLIFEITGGNPERIAEVLADTDMMNMINERADGLRRPGIVYRLGLITAELERDPEIDALIPRTASGQFRFTFPQLERLNRSLPKEIQFTDGDFGTMRRNEDLLIDAGFAPPSVLEGFAAAMAKEAGTLEGSRGRFTSYFNPEGLFVQEDNITGEVTVLDEPTDLEDYFRVEDVQRETIIDLNREILAAMREDREVDPAILTQLGDAERRLGDVGAAIAAKGDSSEYQRLIDEGNRINEALAANPTVEERATLEANLKDNRDRIKFLTTRTGLTEFDVGSRALATAAANANDRLISLERERGETIGLMQRVQSAKGDEITGVQGWIRRKVGGVLQQLHPELAEVINVVIGGTATAAQAAAFDTAAQSLVAQQIPVIAGDESGRYTDIERRITALAVQATSAGASAQQIQAALGEIWMLQTLLRQEELVRAGRDLDYNLTSEGIVAMGTEFKAKGLNLEQAEIMLNRLRNIIPGLEAEAVYRRGLMGEKR